jgi:multisubunit Na+/H+ antiporter MnhC subunit/multisubunit Na+/H+ antiporter MnhB subunit
MSVILALDICLAVLVLAVAGWTVAAREAFAAVVGYVAYGLLVSLVWVRLFAVDVALTEAAIGGGVTGVLLISAAVRLRGTEAAVVAEWPGTGSRLFSAVLCVVVTAGLAAAVLMMPDPGATLAPEADRHLAETGLGNPVTAVLMAFRALDTLLEKVVLFLAVIGVWSLAADGNWGGSAGPQRTTHRQGALAFLAQLLPPVGIVVAIHVVWVGADEPGGAFQGGAILAAMWLIVIMARLAEAPAISGHRLRLALVAGPAVFLAVGLMGFAVAGAFLAYPAGLAKPLIVFIEVFMTLSIAVSLPMLVLGPPDPAALMSAPTLAGLTGAALVGLGLYGLLVHPHPLRKLLGFNLLGSGVFLLFGLIARKGAAAGLAADPVPQALVITGIVVAFCATALSVALLLRLFEARGSTTLRADVSRDDSD